MENLSASGVGFGSTAAVVRVGYSVSLAPVSRPFAPSTNHLFSAITGLVHGKQRRPGIRQVQSASCLLSRIASSGGQNFITALPTTSPARVPRRDKGRRLKIAANLGPNREIECIALQPATAGLNHTPAYSSSILANRWHEKSGATRPWMLSSLHRLRLRQP